MSDNFEMLVDVEVALEDAAEACKAVVARFREIGLITGDLNRDCVLDGVGYRPGPGALALYKPAKGDCRFWELWTCGVEIKVGRSFNEFAMGSSFEWMGCPNCVWKLDMIDDSFYDFEDAVNAATRQWIEQSGPCELRCPGCSKKTQVTKWLCQPPMGFGNLSFSFWNWPSLDDSGWQLDIRKVVAEVTQHEIILTHGHL